MHNKATYMRCVAAIAFGMIMPSSVSAGSSDSTSMGITLRVPLICKATMESITPVAAGLRVEIRELCNGGSGYDLELLHDGAGVRSLTYNNVPVDYKNTTATVLATRNGPYHGRRTLFIETAGSTPTIYGVAVKRAGNGL